VNRETSIVNKVSHFWKPIHDSPLTIHEC